MSTSESIANKTRTNERHGSHAGGWNWVPLAKFVISLLVLSTVWLFGLNGWNTVLPIVIADKYRDINATADVIGSTPNTFAIGTGSMGSLDPILAHNVIGTITKVSNDNKPEPGLSDRWETSSNGRTWTFHVRNGAKFSDGTKITANDFVKSMQYAMRTKVQYADKLDTVLESVNATDDSTMVIKLKQPMAVLPYLLSSSLGRVWLIDNVTEPKIDGVMDDKKTALKTIPVTSGPFRITSYSADKNGMWSLSLERNIGSSTAKDLKVASLKVNVVDENRAKEDVLNGRVQYAIADHKVDYDLDKAKNKGKTVLGNGTHRIAIAFNGRTDRPYPALSDRRFRQGIRYAIDRQSVLNAIGGSWAGDGATQIAGPVVPGALGYEDKTPAWPFDSVKGRQTATSYFGIYPMKIIVPDWAGGSLDVISSNLSAIAQYSRGSEVLNGADYQSRMQSLDWDISLITVNGMDGMKDLLDGNAITGVDSPDVTTAYNGIFSAKNDKELTQSIANATNVMDDWSTVDWIGSSKTSIWTQDGWTAPSSDFADVHVDLSVVTGPGELESR